MRTSLDQLCFRNFLDCYTFWSILRLYCVQEYWVIKFGSSSSSYYRLGLIVLGYSLNFFLNSKGGIIHISAMTYDGKKHSSMSKQSRCEKLEGLNTYFRNSILEIMYNFTRMPIWIVTWNLLSPGSLWLSLWEEGMLSKVGLNCTVVHLDIKYTRGQPQIQTCPEIHEVSLNWSVESELVGLGLRMLANAFKENVVFV